MPEKRRKFDKEFRAGAVRIVLETGKPIVQVARDLGVNEGTLGNWVARDREARAGTAGLSTGDIVELKRLRADLYRVPVAFTCALLGVSVSWFYKWRDRAPTKTEKRRARLDAAVARAFTAARGLHGSPRLLNDLLQPGSDLLLTVGANAPRALVRVHLEHASEKGPDGRGLLESDRLLPRHGAGSSRREVLPFVRLTHDR